MTKKWAFTAILLLAFPLYGQIMTPFAIPFDTLTDSCIQQPFHALNDTSRLIVRDGHFFTRNKQPYRAWGINLSFAANFPTHADAEKLARRLAAAGINSVRCHHMDTAPWPRGIYNPDYQSLNTEALDRLCYLIDQLAKHGIYTNLNLHVGAQYSKYLKLPPSNRKYDKVVNLFTQPLIDAQIQYAKTLLNQVNPYRHKRLANDPAIGFVEITNENSFFMWDGDKALRNLEPFYRDILQKQYNQWLKKHYSSNESLKVAWCPTMEAVGTNQLTNSSFSRPDTRQIPSHWQLEQHNRCSAAAQLNRRSLTLTPEHIDDIGWHLQFKQGDLTILADQFYTLTFQASSASPRTLSLTIGQNHEPWNSLGLSREIKLTSQPRQFRMIFRARQSDTNARISFSFGNQAIPFTLSNVQLKPGAQFVLENESLNNDSIKLYAESESQRRQQDRLVFLAETEKKYFDLMARTIKQEIGCQALVTGTIVFGPLGLYAQSGMDYIDTHAYWQHPNFPGRPWDMNNWHIKQIAMSSQPDNSTLFKLAACRLADKPFTVSEYNHPAPLDSQSECVPMIASYAALQNWDGIWLYTYCHNNSEFDRQHLNTFFDIDTNPAKWGFIAAGAAVYRDKNLSPFRYQFIFPQSSISPTPLDALAAEYLISGNSFADAFRIPRHCFTDSAIALSRSSFGKEIPLAPDEAVTLTWNTTDNGSLYAAQSPQSLTLCGATSRFNEIANCPIKVSTPAQATMMITSMDHKPFDQSKKILIAACGRCENQNMVFSQGRTTVGTQWGQAPVHIETVTADIPLPPGRWTCQPLKPNGTPFQQFTCDKTVALKPKYATMWYLLTR